MRKNYKNLFSIFALLSSSLAFGQHFTEDFENGGTFPPTWTLTNGTDDWQIGDGTTRGPGSAHSGTYAAYFDDYNFSSGTTADMITPAIDLTNATNPELHFWYSDDGGSDVVEVLVSTDGTTYTSVFTTPSTTNDTWTEMIVPIYNLGGQSSVTIAFRGTSVYGFSNPHVDDITVVDGPTCPAPTGLTASNITSSGADIAWTTGGATNWNIEYGPAGFTQGSGTFAFNITNPYSISGLSPNTDYDIYVQDSCGTGDVSAWVMANITTLPTAHNFPLTEDFEDSTLFFEDANSNTPWVLTTNLAHAGTMSAYNGYGNSEINILYESGVLDLSSTTTPFLEFWQIAKTEGNYDDCLVEISTDGGITYSAIPSSAYRGNGDYQGLFDEDSYTEWGNSSNTTLDNSMWKKESFDLSAYNVANVRVRFKLDSDGSASREGWYIDDIMLYEPTCPTPYDLAQTYQNEDTVVVSWTAGLSETAWNIEYGPIGFTHGTGTTVSGLTTTTDTITGLALGSVFDVYVQASCSATDSSDWFGPLTFSTPITNDSACNPITVPVDGNTYIYSNVGATIESGESALSGMQYNTVWFEATVPQSGHFIIATCGSEHSTVVGAYYTDTLICDSMETFGQLAYSSSNSSICGGFGNGSVYICGATPGSTVLFYVGNSGSSASNEGVIRVTLVDASLDGYAGEGPTTPVAACAGDTVELWPHLSNELTHAGTWEYPSNPNAIVDDSLVNTGAFSLIGNEVYYIVSNNCDADTATVVINAATQTNTGTAVPNFQACNAGDVFLFDGLTGTIDAGGTWSDDSNTGLLVNNKFVANGLPVGPYNFTYTVSNNVCPPASTTITVNLVDCTNITEEGSTSFTIYPNPNNGTFFISNGGNESNVAMQVIDIQGKVIFSGTFNLAAGAQKEVSLGNAEAGVYLVKIVTNNNVINHTVVVK